MARKYTFIYSFREYNFLYQGLFNFADASIFIPKNQLFTAKIVPLLKAIAWEL